MTKLNWKQVRDNRHEHRARASAGGTYRIWDYSGAGGGHGGFVVEYCPPKRRWWPQIGIAPTASEAIAIAEAHNDRRLAEKLSEVAVV